MAKVNELTNQEKVYNLYLELVRAERDKKDTNKAHSDNIKRIKDEIKELIEEAEAEVVNAQREADLEEKT
jgi:hypothetical protein